MSTLERAIQIAADAHAGQFDKGGAPYILHPLRVMMSLQVPAQQIVAVLHDVVEDSKVTLGDLRAAGFPNDVLTAIRALTKKKGETRLEAAARAATNPIARAVKLADVSDNMDLGRIARPSESDVARIREYEEVRALLLAPPGGPPKEKKSEKPGRARASKGAVKRGKVSTKPSLMSIVDTTEENLGSGFVLGVGKNR